LELQGGGVARRNLQGGIVGGEGWAEMRDGKQWVEDVGATEEKTGGRRAVVPS
jgi:hypothetical protein